MKTTLDLDNRLLVEAKRQAASGGLTLKSFVEEALRARMLARPKKRKRFRLQLPVVDGSTPPTVDVTDRRTPYDFMGVGG